MLADTVPDHRGDNARRTIAALASSISERARGCRISIAVTEPEEGGATSHELAQADLSGAWFAGNIVARPGHESMHVLQLDTDRRADAALAQDMARATARVTGANLTLAIVVARTDEPAPVASEPRTVTAPVPLTEFGVTTTDVLQVVNQPAPPESQAGVIVYFALHSPNGSDHVAERTLNRTSADFGDAVTLAALRLLDARVSALGRTRNNR
jgi:nicotinamide mononucleotide (NMN) deamidase PncC